uniref:Uncharacterized protein n=1 Tax=Gasterosteus aculeatus TaxID=69293 RepID=G3PEJ8_GASAC
PHPPPLSLSCQWPSHRLRSNTYLHLGPRYNDRSIETWRASLVHIWLKCSTSVLGGPSTGVCVSN